MEARFAATRPVGLWNGAETGLVEREPELANIRATLARVQSGAGSVMVFEGAPGVGKSRLLAEAAQIAEEEEDVEILTAGGREIEREFTFGGALQLFEARVAQEGDSERGHLLSGAARLAVPLLGDGPRDALPNGQAFSLLHGLYWLCSNLAKTKPVALCLDDAQWLDVPTLRFLLYIAQRVGDLPVAILLAVGPNGRGPRADLLAEIAAHPATEVLHPAPFSVDATSDVLRMHLAREPHQAFAEACFEAAEGNPFLTHEVAREVAASAVVPDRDNVRLVYELAPTSLVDHTQVRLSRHGEAARALAVAAAILGDGSDLRHAADLARLDLEAAAEAADGLTATCFLRPERQLTFAHPIVRRAVYSAQTPTSLGEGHLRAAELLSSAGAPEERVAAHLLRARRSGATWAVEVLRAAASAAIERAAPDAAVTYLRRALDEPPEDGSRGFVVLQLGQAEARAGEKYADERLTEAIDLLPDSDSRAQASLEAGRVLLARGRYADSLRVFERGLGDLPPDAGHTAGQLRASVAVAGLAGRRQGFRPVTRITDAAPDPETTAGRLLLAGLACGRAFGSAPYEEVRALARAALGHGALLKDETSDGLAYYLAVTALVLAEDLQTAELAVAAAVEDALARGSVLGHANASLFRAWSIYRRGRLDDAAEEANNALSAKRYGWKLGISGARALVAQVMIERGQLQEAQEQVEIAETNNGIDVLPVFSVQSTRGHVQLMAGRPREAVAEFAEAGRRLDAAGVVNPAVAQWRLGAAVAHHQMGDDEQATALLHEQLELARAVGAPGTIGRTLQTLGWIQGGPSGLDLMASGAEALEDTQLVLDRARALVDLGGALRRAGRRRDARQPLRRGLELAERCGARALVARALEESTAAGARPRRTALSGLESLTARETQVAGLATEGMSNREIAEALFVTVKTVEWHLRHVFGKLGVSSRAELRTVLKVRTLPDNAGPG